ncbi:MAG: hypothetical protein E6Q97_30900 [Desulfurellales bacterium]|nr:MAG: hypothetical protein E6Q97_30900 [Desulfurellales bacterium]
MPRPSRSPLDDIKATLARRGQQEMHGTYIRVSGIDQCQRRQSMLRHFPPTNPTNWQSAYNMEEGNWAEAGMVPLLDYSDWVITDAQKELDLYEYDKEGVAHLVLRGHIDGLMRHRSEPDAVPVLWENKFLGGYGFKKIVEAGVEYGNPGYYTQAQVYMHLLRREYPEMDHCAFFVQVKDPAGLFENRGKQPGDPGYVDPVYFEWVEYDETHALLKIGRATRLYWEMSDGLILPHERRPGDWDCAPRFCPVYDACNPEATFGPAPKKKR